MVQVEGRILRHARRVVVRLVLEAESLACWHTICQRCGAHWPWRPDARVWVIIAEGAATN